jgi:ApaG protein
MTNSEASTRGVRVEVESEYIPEQSDPQTQFYFFAYHITITNEGNMPVQLLNRHWIITDGNGKVEEVKGPGVIGEQPTLDPGDSFNYSSFCPLPTPMGTMRGYYDMRLPDGQHFNAEIAEFRLEHKATLH